MSESSPQDAARRVIAAAVKQLRQQRRQAGAVCRLRHPFEAVSVPPL